LTDEVADTLISHLYANVPTVLEAYFSLPAVILKTDYFRYLLLLARGGIYADIDTEALRPAHQWLPPTSPPHTVGLIVGVEADPTREDWAHWYARRIQFCQWVFRAKPGHPVLREVVARIAEATLERKRKGELHPDGESLSIIEWTGPAVWTDSIFGGMNRESKTARGTKGGEELEEWSWVQFTGITEPKVTITRHHLSFFVTWSCALFVLGLMLIAANWGYPCVAYYGVFAWNWTYGKSRTR
jgi:alpha 1,6-mannosyltransferase